MQSGMLTVVAPLLCIGIDGTVQDYLLTDRE